MFLLIIYYHPPHPTFSDAPVFLVHPVDTVVVEKQGLLLSCAADGRPTPFVAWKKDGEVLNPKHRGFIAVTGGTSELEFSSVLRSDQGSYSCWANNSVNVAESQSGVVTVNCEYKTLVSRNYVRCCCSVSVRVVLQNARMLPIFLVHTKKIGK